MNLRPPLRLLACFVLTLHAQAATTIHVSDTVVLADAKRLGINLSFHTYYDSRLMMKELCFRNPGFEGLVFQSILQSAAGGTATSVSDTNPYTQWANGYWNGASYEFVTGTAKGRRGTVTGFTQSPRSQPAPPSIGSSFTFGDSGTIPAAGDYFVLRRAANENPQSGWWDTSTSVTLSGETGDLAPDTPGRQALRAVSTASSGVLRLSSNIDTWRNATFILLNGDYRVSFKAKSRSGTSTLNVRVQRGSNNPYLNQNVTLASSWTTHTLSFTAAETASASGIISLAFSTSGQFDLLLDDVSFVQTNTSPSNPTAFRDAVVDALVQYRPGIIRALQDALGWQLDNALAPMLARRRSGYTAYGMDQPNLEFGYHEFLELCAHVGAEPWIPVPVVFSDDEMRNFIEYLAGPSTSPYGARRAARGQTRPWTEVFPKIHLEFGNESWNAENYLGGAITNPASYGVRGSELFGHARSSPWFSTARFNLILGGQAGNPARSLTTHTASSQHDAFAVDGYFFTQVDSFANNEEMFGSFFAQSELLNTRLFIGELAERLRTSARPVPLAIYEANINTSRGAIFTSQSALTSLTASLGAGLGVANDLLMKKKLHRMRDVCLFNLGGYAVFERGSENNPNFAALWGVTRDMGVTNRKRPTYLATQLANTAIIGDLVQTTHSGDDPTWNQPEINRVLGGLPNAHHLHSYGFAAPDGTRSLVLFNLHRTSALPVNFSGPNAPGGTVTLRRLSSAAITDHNEDREMVAAPTTQTLASFSATSDLSLPPFSMTLLSWSNGTTPTPPPVTPAPAPTPSPTPPPTISLPAGSGSARGSGGGSPSHAAGLALVALLLLRRRQLRSAAARCG